MKKLWIVLGIVAFLCATLFTYPFIKQARLKAHLQTLAGNCVWYQSSDSSFSFFAQEQLIYTDTSTIENECVVEAFKRFPFVRKVVVEDHFPIKDQQMRHARIEDAFRGCMIELKFNYLDQVRTVAPKANK